MAPRSRITTIVLQAVVSLTSLIAAGMVYAIATAIVTLGEQLNIN